jgi:hypothetical protein
MVDLISITATDNEVGDSITQETPRQVFANKRSIKQSEFYQAAMTDLRPELQFDVRTIDYQAERELKWNNKSYDIIRVYTKNDEITQLICQGKSGDV